MKFLALLSAQILFPLILLSQQGNNIQALQKGKMMTRTSKDYYRNNTNLPGSFISHYVELVRSFRKDKWSAPGYRTGDTLMAYKQIKTLEKEQNILCQLMRARLKWEYEERLQKGILDSSRSLLSDNKDSAFYFFTMAMFYKDSMYENIARRLGYVKVSNKGIEEVDWKRMNSFVFKGDILFMLTGYPGGVSNYRKEIEDSFIPYFEKAIGLDKKEFYYMAEMVLFLIKLNDESFLQQKILHYKTNYSPKEQKWLDARLTESYYREKRSTEVKKAATNS